MFEWLPVDYQLFFATKAERHKVTRRNPFVLLPAFVPSWQEKLCPQFFTQCFEKNICFEFTKI
jgi:hypothetical protein